MFDEFHVIRFIIGICLLLTAIIGKPSSLDKDPNTATFVFLTGILLMGLSIS